MEHSIIRGLYYIPNFISNDDYEDIMRALNETTEWLPVGTSKNSRRVLHYGYSYSYNRSGIKKIEDIPELYKKILDITKINNILNKEVIDKNNFEQLIINEYKPSQGIYKHIDHIKYFGPIIVCFTVGFGTNIEFIHNDKIINVYVEPKSVYIMTGDSRYKWTHGIKQCKYDIIEDNDNMKKIARETRYSITFRSVNIKDLNIIYGK